MIIKRVAGVLRRSLAVAGVAALGLVSVGTGPAKADLAGRPLLGHGSLFTNDFFGDAKDRWHTGSFAASRVWGRNWDGAPQGGFGDILEFRFNSAIYAPSSLRSPAPKDRPYANALSFGLFTHFDLMGLEASTGADLVLTGPQTGLEYLQDRAHDFFNSTRISDTTKANAIEDGVHGRVVMEVGKGFDFGMVNVRPFAEARYGVEDLVRVGGDIRIGRIGRGELLVRDSITGQRYRTIQDARGRGTTLVIGADQTWVSESLFLPADRVTALKTRERVRVGIDHQGSLGNLFYGATWMGPEFEGQDAGQIVGSVRFRLNF